MTVDGKEYSQEIRLVSDPNLAVLGDLVAAQQEDEEMMETEEESEENEEEEEERERGIKKIID